MGRKVRRVHCHPRFGAEFSDNDLRIDRIARTENAFHILQKPQIKHILIIVIREIEAFFLAGQHRLDDLLHPLLFQPLQKAVNMRIPPSDDGLNRLRDMFRHYGFE